MELFLLCIIAAHILRPTVFTLIRWAGPSWCLHSGDLKIKKITHTHTHTHTHAHTHTRTHTHTHTHTLSNSPESHRWCSNCSVQVPSRAHISPHPHCCEIIYHSKLTVKLHFISPRSQTFFFVFSRSLSPPNHRRHNHLPFLSTHAAQCPRN